MGNMLHMDQQSAPMFHRLKKELHSDKISTYISYTQMVDRMKDITNKYVRFPPANRIGHLRKYGVL